ncbi:SDR family oxidoreductase [Polyangium jinanense]|uniref:SDR family oxidoreductase n=1 Tax=Polyangium jinanense TaxID=2829994 RepID=UPI003FD7A7A6
MIQQRLAGKVALVTGGARGIGAGIARRLAGDGADVVINYHTNVEAAEQVKAAVESLGRRAYIVQADVSTAGGRKRLFDTVDAACGRLDILVNNAANYMMAPLHAVDEDMFDGIMALNMRAAFFATREAASRLGSGGRVINISSSLSIVPAPGTSVYAGAKAAIEAFTRVHALEFAPRQITVNAIAPGAIDTDALRAGLPAEARARIPEGIPLGRVGEVSDIVGVVAFIASDDARWITGQVIHVNGGAVMR